MNIKKKMENSSHTKLKLGWNARGERVYIQGLPEISTKRNPAKGTSNEKRALHQAEHAH